MTGRKVKKHSSLPKALLGCEEQNLICFCSVISNKSQNFNCFLEYGRVETKCMAQGNRHPVINAEQIEHKGIGSNNKQKSVFSVIINTYILKSILQYQYQGKVCLVPYSLLPPSWPDLCPRV